MYVYYTVLPFKYSEDRAIKMQNSGKYKAQDTE